MYIDKQLLYQRGGKWELSKDFEVADKHIPETLQDLLMARFDRLEPEERAVLQVGSVIGRQFNLGILELAIRRLDSIKLNEVINSLVEKAFIVPKDGDGLEYTFRHVLTSDAIYHTLLRRDRENLHTLVGEALEKLYREELGNYVEVLAGHYLRTSHLAKALNYLILAGEKSVRNYAYVQAKHHYLEALQLLTKVNHTPEQALSALIGMGDVYTFIGEYELARKNYLEALDLIEGLQPFIDVKKHCAVHRKIGTTYERQGDFELALEHLVEANKALGKTAILSPSSKAEILNDLGWIYFLQGNFEEAQKNLNIGLNLVEGTDEYGIIASIHNRLGALAYQKREYEEAAIHVRNSLALRKKIGDHAGVARLYNNLGLLSLMQGNLREAEENFLQSSDLLEKSGDAEGIALTNINLGLVKLERGDFERAEQYLNKAHMVADQIGHRFYLALSRMYLGRMNTSLSKYSNATRLLSSSMSLFEEIGSLDHKIDGMGYLAENCLACGDPESAIKWCRSMEDTIAMREEASELTSLQMGRLFRIKGKIARFSREPDRATNLLNEGYRIFKSSSEKLESARTIYELGLLAKDQGDQRKANKLFQEAHMLFEEIGADYDLRTVEDAII
jgi:tetratricopeptide (TPR) repeat protein